MLSYIIALAAGVTAGFFLPGGFMAKPKSAVFNIALLGLLFFMGVNLGRDPELLSKLSKFGIISALMSFSVVIFSLLAVMLLMRLTGSGRK